MQLAGRRDDHVFWRSDSDRVVAQVQREFTTAKKLLVLPAAVVGVSHNAGEPLGHFVNVVVVFLEVLEAASCADQLGVNDVEPIVDLELEGFAWCQWLGQVDSHHRLDNRAR